MAFNVLTPRLIVPHLTLLSGPFCAISLSFSLSLSLFLALFIRIAALALFSRLSLWLRLDTRADYFYSRASLSFVRLIILLVSCALTIENSQIVFESREYKSA